MSLTKNLNFFLTTLKVRKFKIKVLPDSVSAAGPFSHSWCLCLCPHIVGGANKLSDHPLLVLNPFMSHKDISKIDTLNVTVEPLDLLHIRTFHKMYFVTHVS